MVSLLFCYFGESEFLFFIFRWEKLVETAKVIPQEEVSLEIEQTISQEEVSSNLIESKDEGLNREKIFLSIKLYPRLQNQQVSYSISDDKKIGDKVVQSLEFKVRNSLNFTVCKLFPTKKVVLHYLRILDD